MMEDHFGLERAPFRLGTDASFYYEAEAHRRAMAHLRYGLRQAEGFVVITGEPGVGKTMVVEQLLLSVQDSDVLAGMLVPNGLTTENLAERVLAAFDRRPVEGADPTESLRDYLADERRRGAKASLIIDEAQHLSDAILEDLRLLSDLTHDGEALLQVCLIGQTGLRRVLFRDDMEQFRQRIVASYHLAPLSVEDTEAYIRHRMKAAGRDGPDVFTEAALGAIHRLSGGVPRRINTLCARLLLQAAMDGRDVVDADDAQGAAGALADDRPEAEPQPDGPAEVRPKAVPPKLTVVGAAPAAAPDAAPDAAPEPAPGPAPGPVPGTTAGPGAEAPDEASDEEAEAERALALVTAPPPDAALDDAVAPPPAPASEPYRIRAEGGGAPRGYPVSVGEINAAIQSIRTEPAPREAAPRPRMASPQELMLRRPKGPPPPAAEAPGAEPPSAPSEPRTGDQERALRAFLAETETALAELRGAMDALRAQVDDLDARRRARRARIEVGVDEARARLDAFRAER